MQTGVIISSMRSEGESRRLGRSIAAQLEGAVVIDLYDLDLPLWNSPRTTEEERDRITTLRKTLAACTSYCFVSPEYHGMASPSLKNFLLYAEEMEHKPVLLVTVSSGRGGRYPVAELRMSGYKNRKYCLLPEHLIIDHCTQVLHEDPAQNDPKADAYIRDRISYTLQLLRVYDAALQTMRDTHADALCVERYENGM